MRYEIAVTVMCLCSAVHAGDVELIKIHHVDPRMVTNTSESLAGTDIISTRTLTKTESAQLLKLLEMDLRDLDPGYCGHHPAYVIQRVRGNKTVSVVTVCGLCMTWQKAGGELRGLGGKDALAYLQKLLPLSDVFRDVEKLPDLYRLFADQEKVPFYALDRGANAETPLKSTPLQSGSQKNEPEDSTQPALSP